MNTTHKLSKKYIILPVVLVAGIVVTSIFTTATSSVLQSVKSNISRVSTDTEQVQEELQSKTSLTYLSEKIDVLGFAKQNSEYIKGAGTPLAYR